MLTHVGSEFSKDSLALVLRHHSSPKLGIILCIHLSVAADEKRSGIHIRDLLK